ncbi:hypothetical protein [Pseudomonas putida]|uniref:hypothetical protein n=1 Tax=Pseudomonas putida TaxID=303 RepID=UPI000F7775A5|nr:hypothetical protein [Pseudomonas putida]
MPDPRLSLALLGLATILLLGGCESGPKADAAPPVDPKARQAFIEQTMGMLHHDMLAATGGQMAGVLNLEVTLDRDSRPIACSTHRAKASLAVQFPQDMTATDRKLLASTVQSQCWKTVYPKVPAGMQGDKGEVQLVAPLVLLRPPYVSEREQQRRQQHADNQFLWRTLMRDEPVDSVGLALIRYQADAAGRVTGCLVELAPHPVRKDAFRMDGALQARLNRQCLNLDLGQMPGFAPDAHGNFAGNGLLEYAPWKVGRD